MKHQVYPYQCHYRGQRHKFMGRCKKLCLLNISPIGLDSAGIFHNAIPGEPFVAAPITSLSRQGKICAKNRMCANYITAYYMFYPLDWISSRIFKPDNLMIIYACCKYIFINYPRLYHSNEFRPSRWYCYQLYYFRNLIAQMAEDK